MYFILDIILIKHLLFFHQHETAEGGNQAIRIKRHVESVFLPVRKLGGVGATKGKVRTGFISEELPLVSVVFTLIWTHFCSKYLSYMN